MKKTEEDEEQEKKVSESQEDMMKVLDEEEVWKETWRDTHTSSWVFHPLMLYDTHAG